MSQVGRPGPGADDNRTRLLGDGGSRLDGKLGSSSEKETRNE